MSNRTLISVALLLAIQTTAGAEMYRCELADGSIIYSDRPVTLSDACQPVPANPANEYLSIQQDKAGSRQRDPDFVAEPAAESEAETKTQLDRWVTRATALVDNYNDARKRRIRESYMVNKRKAMRDMAMLNAEKKAMLSELQESSLSQQERDKVRGVLAGIPEDAP